MLSLEYKITSIIWLFGPRCKLSEIDNSTRRILENAKLLEVVINNKLT